MGKSTGDPDPSTSHGPISTRECHRFQNESVRDLQEKRYPLYGSMGSKTKYLGGWRYPEGPEPLSYHRTCRQKPLNPKP